MHWFLYNKMLQERMRIRRPVKDRFGFHLREASLRASAKSMVQGSIGLRAAPTGKKGYKDRRPGRKHHRVYYFGNHFEKK